MALLLRGTGHPDSEMPAARKRTAFCPLGLCCYCCCCLVQYPSRKVCLSAGLGYAGLGGCVQVAEELAFESGVALTSWV